MSMTPGPCVKPCEYPTFHINDVSYYICINICCMCTISVGEFIYYITCNAPFAKDKQRNCKHYSYIGKSI